jgi:Zn-finger nucleic acid-binding protein
LGRIELVELAGIRGANKPIPKMSRSSNHKSELNSTDEQHQNKDKTDRGAKRNAGKKKKKIEFTKQEKYKSPK